MLDWDDYYLLLHIARFGRVSETADHLKVTSSTIFRRLAAIESKLNMPIFQRDGGRYTPTEEGAAIVNAAEKMEQETAGVARYLSGESQTLSGSVKITTSEVLSSFFVARHVTALGRDHPKLKVQVVSSDRMLDLSRHEADVAIRPKRLCSNALFGRKLATIRWATYVADASHHDEDHPPDTYIGHAGDPRLAAHFGSTAFDPNAADGAQFFASSLVLRAAMCAQGEHAAALPMILGEVWPGLRRVGDVLDNPVGDLWIVCHNDMRRNRRVRAVFDAMIDGARADTALFEGPLGAATGP
ncbi:LysR family transcriptional regulator [uncultured Tateyamaria sp.]|uniref:LysR family transcriptional regulator n=1 Tax=uncultured Tateyamaria sp. TaxID=455651 RepID=UPI002624BD92|nr:LysR family transcriptional regulator [uncultured Tateyamaria sp.]